jgi:hypothetical protein
LSRSPRERLLPVDWIVNLVDGQVAVGTGPGPGSYSSCAVFATGQAVPTVVGGPQVGEIAVDATLS